jgi:hypothetical protein
MTRIKTVRERTSVPSHRRREHAAGLEAMVWACLVRIFLARLEGLEPST